MDTDYSLADVEHFAAYSRITFKYGRLRLGSSMRIHNTKEISSSIA